MRPLRELLFESWNIYAECVGLFVGYTGWALVPYAFVILLPLAPLPPTLIGFGTAALTVAQVALVLWAVNVIILLTSAFLRQKQVRVDHVGRRAWRWIPSVVFVSILSSLAILGGMFLAIIPGIVFWVWYAFSHYEVLLHKEKGRAALMASHALVRGRFWPTLWRLAGGELFILLAYLFLTASAVGVVGILFHLPELSLTTTNPPVWADVLVNILEVILMPLVIVYVTVLYHELLRTKKKES